MTANGILVVGAGGPLGAAVCRSLRAQGRPFVATTRSGSGARLDVSNPVDVEATLARHRPRSVIYLANPGVEDTMDEATISGSVDDLRRFVERSAEYGVERLVFTSSAAVYGTDWDRPVAEDDEPRGRGPYAAVKLRCERVLAETSGGGYPTAVALRIFNIYGPGFARSLINRLIHHDPAPELLLSGTFVRDYIHGDDVARAAILATEAATDRFLLLNVGSGIPTDNRALARAAGEGAYRVAAGTASHSYCVARVDRARAELGFRAEISVTEHLAAASAAAR